MSFQTISSINYGYIQCVNIYMIVKGGYDFDSAENVAGSTFYAHFRSNVFTDLYLNLHAPSLSLM